jgi:hypothetical protein
MVVPPTIAREALACFVGTTAPCSPRKLSSDGNLGASGDSLTCNHETCYDGNYMVPATVILMPHNKYSNSILLHVLAPCMTNNVPPRHLYN